MSDRLEGLDTLETCGRLKPSEETWDVPAHTVSASSHQRVLPRTLALLGSPVLQGKTLRLLSEADHWDTGHRPQRGPCSLPAGFSETCLRAPPAAPQDALGPERPTPRSTFLRRSLAELRPQAQPLHTCRRSCS